MWPTKVRTASPPFQSTLPARGATVGVVQNVANAALFQSTLPARGATGVSLDTLVGRDISIHAPCTGSDFPSVGFSCACSYFNPRSLHGERHATAKVLQTASDFNPRSLHGERQSTHRNRASAAGFQSTLPARGATWTRRRLPSKGEISIHAPCTGSDITVFQALLQIMISIHAPCTGSDSTGRTRDSRPTIFQSTLPARGATVCSRTRRFSTFYFNPRSLHGERRSLSSIFSFAVNFNPRSLHGERRYGRAHS